MKSEGYYVKWTDTRGNITYTCHKGIKCWDDRRLNVQRRWGEHGRMVKACVSIYVLGAVIDFLKTKVKGITIEKDPAGKRLENRTHTESHFWTTEMEKYTVKIMKTLTMLMKPNSSKMLDIARTE